VTDVARLLRCLSPAVAASAVAAATALPGPTAVTTAAMTGAKAGASATASATARGLAAQAASGQAGPGGGLLLSLVRDLAIAACALIACLIGAIMLARLRRRARSVPAAGIAAERSPGGLARHGRHARRQPGGHGGPKPALAGFRPGSARGADVDAGGAPYRPRRLAGKPPWPPASPPGAPLTPAGVPPTLPPMAPKARATETRAAETRATETRATETRAADVPLAPWERSPAGYSAAPVYQDPTPWPVSNTGPMYVWNPAATTAPLNIIGSEEAE
jgi:hypothetical protein